MFPILHLVIPPHKLQFGKKIGSFSIFTLKGFLLRGLMNFATFLRFRKELFVAIVTMDGEDCIVKPLMLNVHQRLA